MFDQAGDLWSSNANSPFTLVKFGPTQITSTGAPTPETTINPFNEMVGGKARFETLVAPNGIAFDQKGNLVAISSAAPFRRRAIRRRRNRRPAARSSRRPSWSAPRRLSTRRPATTSARRSITSRDDDLQALDSCTRHCPSIKRGRWRAANRDNRVEPHFRLTVLIAVCGHSASSSVRAVASIL